MKENSEVTTAVTQKEQTGSISTAQMAKALDEVKTQSRERMESSWALRAAHTVLRTEYNDPETIAKRAEICLNCEHVRAEANIMQRLLRMVDQSLLSSVSCGLCGCLHENKIMIKSIKGSTTSCPDKPPRW